MVAMPFPGDSAFTAGMTSIIHAAQTSMIQIIAGVKTPPEAPPALANGGRNPGGFPGSNAVAGGGAPGGFDEEGDWDAWSTAGEEERSGEVEELLRRQQVRIQELEQRLVDSAVGRNDSRGGRSPTIKTITI